MVTAAVMENAAMVVLRLPIFLSLTLISNVSLLLREINVKFECSATTYC